MPEPLRVGDMLYGYCNGHFGRDSYEDKRVEGIGTDWVVCRDDSGHVHMAALGEWPMSGLDKYRTPPEDDDA